LLRSSASRADLHRWKRRSGDRSVFATLALVRLGFDAKRHFATDDGFAYGPVNLQAAIAEDLEHHIGTNAIELDYGRDDLVNTCNPEPMIKFCIYQPVYSSSNAPHLLRTRVDLDARGAKAMPRPCISCHGGKLRPLDRFGRFTAMHANDDAMEIGDTRSRLQAFEVDTFEFSGRAGHRQEEYEEGLRKLNAAIHCTYLGKAGHPVCDEHGGGVTAQGDIGGWSGDFGREILLGWYGDDGANNNLDKMGSRYDESFVSSGWTPGPGGAPIGADVLFRKVIGPNCFVCHGRRGNELGRDSNSSGEGKDLDFSDWDKFISYADEVERLVYDEGKMSMGLLNFQNFWDDPDKAELLASFIAPYVSNSGKLEARRVNSKGKIVPPGSIVARAGLDRITRPDAPITLSAQSSLFAQSYSWKLVKSPAGAKVELSGSSNMKARFRADLEGDYRLRLTARSSGGGSDTDTIDIKVDGGLAVAPRDLTFIDDIAPVFSDPLVDCISCHDNGAQAGVPVWWVADAGQLYGVPASTADTRSLGFYEQVMAKLNLEVIKDSLRSKKSSGKHHFDNLKTGSDDSLTVGAADRANYDLFANWVSKGAPCGRIAQAAPICVR